MVKYEKPQSLANIFPFIKDKRALGLLSRLLDINPKTRITAEWAGCHDFFYASDEIDLYDDKFAVYKRNNAPLKSIDTKSKVYLEHFEKVKASYNDKHKKADLS